MDTSKSVIDSEILAQYITMSYEDDGRIINSRLINDILYSFQLCYMRYSDGEPLFISEFKAGHDGPELYKSFNRDFNRQLTRVVFNQLSERYLIEDWIASVKKVDSSLLHKIAVNSMSPWSVRYQGDAVRVISNEDMNRYANADKFDNLDGSYLDFSARAASSVHKVGSVADTATGIDSNYQRDDQNDWRS